MSYYMNGPAGWLFGLALVALGAASLVLARHCWRQSEPVTPTVLLAIWGLGACIGGLFPPDPRGHWDRPPSLTGMVHGIAAILAFLAFPAAAILMSRRRTRALSVLANSCLICLVLFFACLAPVFMNRPPIALGLVERVLIALYFAWIWLATQQIPRSSRKAIEDL